MVQGDDGIGRERPAPNGGVWEKTFAAARIHGQTRFWELLVPCREQSWSTASHCRRQWETSTRTGDEPSGVPAPGPVQPRLDRPVLPQDRGGEDSLQEAHEGREQF